MKSTLIAAVAGLATITGAAHAGGNLLNNAGFEEPLGFDFADVTNWNGFFGGPAGTFLQAFNDVPGTPVRSGNAALLTTIEAGDDMATGGLGAFTGHVQNVIGVTGDNIYNYSIWARSVGEVTNGAEFRIEFFDAGNNEIGRSNMEIQDMLTSEYQQFSIEEIAPTGTAYAKAVIAVQSFTNNGVEADISVAWDDASFTLVPAPGAMALVGLGGLVATRRRR